MPDVIQCHLAGVSLVALARVNGVVKVRNVSRHQARNLRLAIVSEEERGEPVRTEIPSLQRMDLVLLAMFEHIEETVAEGRLHRKPLPSRAQVDVPVVRRKRGERFETGSNRINGRQVYRVVAFPDIECAAIRLDAFDDGGDDDVWVRIAVAVRVGAEIVGDQETADLDELRDG